MIKTPTYRKRKSRNQAVVTLTDQSTKQRRDYYLGTYDTPQSREAYHRLIAEWEAFDRRLPAQSHQNQQIQNSLIINDLIQQYWESRQDYYSESELNNLRLILRALRQLYGSTLAIEFGPKRLKILQTDLLTGNTKVKPTRKRWSRLFINKQLNRLIAMFRWASSQELLPVTVYQQLKTLTSLRKGRTKAHEPDPIQPVPIETVEAVRPYLSRQVNALITLQLHTGARSGELFTLRPIDLNIDDDSGIWTIVPELHKTAHFGHTRTIYVGPTAQKAIRPFLHNRSANSYLFSPAEAETERRAALHATRITPMSCGNKPGSNRTTNPTKKPGDHYATVSYHHAIRRACDLAFPPKPPLAKHFDETNRAWQSRLTKKQKEELKAWQKAHRWHPHQLRHTAGTIIRKQFGLEAAQLALGHSSAMVTDAVYAERDMTKVIEIMKKIG